MRNLGCGLVIAIAAACGGGDDGPGGGGSDGGTCACDFGERCVQNVCTPVRYLALNVSETTTTNGVGAAATGCFYRVAATDPLVISETEDGLCTITVLQQGTTQSITEARDGGQLRIEGTSAGTLSLAPTPSTAGCYSSMTAAADLFADGATIRFVGTGGVDLPAFSEEVEAPSTIQFTAGTPVAGQPHALTWSGAPAGRVNYSLISIGVQPTTYVFCQLPDTGSFTLPASTTSRLPAGATFYQGMGRYNRVHLEPAGTDAVIDLTVTTYDTVP
ncbi:MAG TPA: hypothetical protein VM513_25980 [Kofleriaceae bacterium]|nr:hypothetical protein [Kofleriaceae bacterium]